MVPPKDETTKELEDRLERCRGPSRAGNAAAAREELARRAADVEARPDAEDAAPTPGAAQQRRGREGRKGVARRRPDDDAVNGDYSSRDAEIEALKAVARLQLQGDSGARSFATEHRLQTAYEAQKREVDDLTARVKRRACARSIEGLQKKRPTVREAQTPVADKGGSRGGPCGATRG